jgi:exonuclease SbcD
MLIENVTDLLHGYYDELDASLPTVVTAHMSVDTATAGIEQELLIGYTLTFPLEIFVDDRVDYVALGHIHKHQVVRQERPLALYAGSLERIDFGEEKEDKGFVHVQLERGKAAFEFHSIQPRSFVTVDVDLTEEVEPLEKLTHKIDSAVTPGCVLRLRYKIKQEQLDLIDEDVLRRHGADALSIKLQPEIIASHSRARLPQLTESTIASPMVALETYLEEVAPERKERLLERARSLMEQDGESER